MRVLQITALMLLLMVQVSFAQTKMRFKNPVDSIKISRNNLGTELSIISPSGIGWAEINKPINGWGKTVLLKFSFLRLEHVSVQAGNWKLECNQIDTRYACTLKQKNILAVTKTKTGFVLRLPKELVAAKNLRLEWVNEWR